MNGFYNVLKPPGITSSDVVVQVRRIITSSSGARVKVGHLGTLDPLGAGVLPIAVGSATKLFNYLLDKTKVYRAKFVFGVTTDTLDGDGKIVFKDNRVVTDEEIEAVIPSLLGEVEQVPPQFSSKSVNGVRAYKLARQGITVALESKKVNIYSITTVERGHNEYVFDLSVSGGTYIRSICRDMAELLGTCSYMASIIRLQNGEFNIDDSNTLEEIERSYLTTFLTLEQYKERLPSLDIDAQHKKKIDNGVAIFPKCMPDGLFALTVGGEAYGIATGENGRLRVVLRYDKEHTGL